MKRERRERERERARERVSKSERERERESYRFAPPSAGILAESPVGLRCYGALGSGFGSQDLPKEMTLQQSHDWDFLAKQGREGAKA
jgi:hypothetical protein